MLNKRQKEQKEGIIDLLRKKIEQKDRLITILTTWIVLISMFFAYTQYINHKGKDYTIQDVCLSCSKVYGERDYQTMNLTKFFDTIQEKCGDTYMVKRHNDNDYSVFTRICIDDNYCKYDYIKLEECLYK